MTGQTLEAPGRQVVFQSAAAIFFISGGRGEIKIIKLKKKKTKEGGEKNQMNTN